ncbi:unnamed protein product [Orchesella dallaii]|uniref:RIIa domain-containing protein n=1 Tax=Orchesella dallaii TaxID=48710 RepID=A0ABP1QVM3_9HEXA
MAVRNLPEMPCGPLLELQGQRKRFHVPYGLKPLMEDMTIEVLRVQPNDVMEFLASFLEDRVKKKQEALSESNSRRKSWLVHRWSWEASSVLSKEAFREFIHFLPITEDNADHYATIIQAAFRGHQARERVKEIKRSRKSGSERVQAFEEFLKALKLTVEEADHYATKIQAAYRGFHTREMIKGSKEEAEEEEVIEQNPDEEPEMEDDEEDHDRDGIVLYQSDPEEGSGWEGSSTELEDARTYDTIDSATEEEESVNVDEMVAQLEQVEDTQSELEVITSKENLDNISNPNKEQDDEEEEDEQ